MVEMLTQKPPWPNLIPLQLMYQLSEKKMPEYTLHQTISQTAQNFLTDIFNYDEKTRPTSECLLGHPWFKRAEIGCPGDKV